MAERAQRLPETTLSFHHCSALTAAEGETMQSLFFGILAIGFVICSIGMYFMTYVEHRLNRPRGAPKPADRRGGRVWPLYIAFTCIPLGIAIMFAAIVWKNHLPR